VKRAGAVLLLLAAAAPVALSDDAAPFAVINARVVTVSGPVLERGTVLVSGGKIAAVGADVAVPEGTETIDAGGQTLYPGLIDALTTVGLTEIGSVPGSVDVSELGDVNPQARAWIALQPHSELIPVTRANGVTATLAAPEGGLVSGQSALIRLAGSTPEALVIKGPAALHVQYPSGRPRFDFAAQQEPELKTFVERQQEKKANQEKALRRLGGLLDDARAFAAGRAAAAGSGKPDLGLESLAPFARGELPVVIRADSEADIRGAVAFAAQRGLKTVIAGGAEAWRCADLLKEKDAAVLIKVDRVPPREDEPYDAEYTNAAALQRRGVRFAIVTDDAALSRNLPYEAAMARAFGLPAAAALRAITLSPAEIFGVADRLGSIEAGKQATLVLASGDIMDARTQVTRVWIDGAPQSLETKHTRLFQQFKDRP
jgi:imidazolonepropionase-like amidohydrolase